MLADPSKVVVGVVRIRYDAICLPSSRAPARSLWGSFLVSYLYRTLAILYVGRVSFGSHRGHRRISKNTYTWMWNTVPGTAFGGTTAWTVLPSGSTTAICWPGDLRGRFVPNEAVA